MSFVNSKLSLLDHGFEPPQEHIFRWASYGYLMVENNFKTIVHSIASQFGSIYSTQMASALGQILISLWSTFFPRVVELTGDVSPDMAVLKRADLIVTTPEKWDGISRSWRQRGYVRDIALIIIDEIHMVGEDRGPILEVSKTIVAFSNCIFFI